MPTVTFQARFPHLNTLVSFSPDKPITVDDVKNFLAEQNIAVDYVGPTADGGFVIKTQAAKMALNVPQGMLLACIPGTQDVLAMAPQVIEHFYMLPAPLKAPEAAVSPDAGELS